MKKDIHPEYFDTKVTCVGCGATFMSGSVLPEIRISTCSACHPFYTGRQVLVDAEGRVDRFNKKYGKLSTTKSGAAA